MRILVTGASGFLGGWVYEEARERGHEVLGTRYSRSFDPEGGQVLVLDVRNPSRIRSTVEDFGPDAVVHAAAMATVERCEGTPRLAQEVNVDGTRNVAKAAAQSDVKVALISTNFVFDGESPPYNEDDEPGPIQVYGRTKRAAERSVSRENAGSLIIRVSDLFGPPPPGGDPPEDLVHLLLSNASQSGELPLVEDVFMSPTYAPAAAAEILDLIEQDESGTFHRAGIDCFNRLEFGRAVADVFSLSTTGFLACRAADLWRAPRPTATCLTSMRRGGSPPRTDLSLHSGLNRFRRAIGTSGDPRDG